MQIAEISGLLKVSAEQISNLAEAQIAGAQILDKLKNEVAKNSKDIAVAGTLNKYLWPTVTILSSALIGIMVYLIR